MGSNPIGGTVPNCSLRSLRIALWSPPTSSSLGDEKRAPSLLCTLLAPLAEAGTSEPLPSSLARRRTAGLFAPSSRTAARQPGSARRRAIRGLIARSARADRSGSGAEPAQDGKRGSFRGQAPLLAVFRRTTRIGRPTALSKLGRKGRCPAFQYTDMCAN
jgi:hypothetical protein